MKNNKKDLLLEIGTEEITARMAFEGVNSLKHMITGLFYEKTLQYDSLKVFSTPRRITLFVEKLSSRQPDTEEEIIGPKVEIAFDKEGNPTKAGESFAKSRGKSASDLIKKESPKGVRVAVQIKKFGRNTKEILEENLPLILSKISFKKKMRWGECDENFVRPVHWIAALFGSEILEFQFAGVKAGSVSRGHRFLSSAPFKVESFAQYLEELKKRYVILDFEERKKIIRDGLKLIEQKTGGNVIEDDELLDEVANLIEFPVVELGNFDEKFLALPSEVIITSLRTHQKYFAIRKKDGSGLLPQFAMVHNNVPREMSVVNIGNERVIKARLSDAMFFFEEDIKKSLDNMVYGLKERTFVKGLGDTNAKTLRVQNITGELTERSGYDNIKSIVKRAAYLCKADLMSQMVFEFPELQGIMGMHYARAQKEPEEVAIAIFEHYLPRFAGDKLPESNAGIILSIADKIDSLAGCFGIGLIPSGSEDPFSLRRQAMGILHILIEKPAQRRFKLSELIDIAIYKYSAFVMKEDEIKKELMNFFAGRLFSVLTSKGIMNEFADSVINADSGFDDPFDTYKRAKAIENFYLEHKDNFEPLIITFKRVGNILKNQNFTMEINENLLSEPSEKKLYNEFLAISKEVANARKNESYDEILISMLKLKPFVDNFFDSVMVMVNDSAIKNNRLSLLSNIRKRFYEFADFSRISTR